MKQFFRHWHYGIKAKVIDDALVAHIDTSVDPVFLRFDLARLQSVMIDVVNKGGDYELVLVGVGAPAATVTLAKFEVRDAAEEAASGLRKALLCGVRHSRFWPAFSVTFGVLAALIVAGLLLSLLGLMFGTSLTGAGVSSASLQAESMLQSVEPSASSATVADPAEPQSAEQFLQTRP